MYPSRPKWFSNIEYMRCTHMVCGNANISLVCTWINFRQKNCRPCVGTVHRNLQHYDGDGSDCIPVWEGSASSIFLSVYTDQSLDHEAQIFGACCLLGSMDWLYLFWYLRSLSVIVSPHSPLQGTHDGLGLCSRRVGRLQISSALFPGTRQDLVWCTSYAYLCARLGPLFSLVRAHVMQRARFWSKHCFAISSNFLIYLFSTLLGKFGSSMYYQLGAITITVVPPVSANHLLINMYNSAHDEQPTWTMASETKASLQLMGDTSRSVFRVHPTKLFDNDMVLRVHHENIELAFVSTKGSEWMYGSLFEWYQSGWERFCTIWLYKFVPKRRSRSTIPVVLDLLDPLERNE
jgi:hypothetical protein